MQNSKLVPAIGKKAESTVRLEEEARQVIEEALIAAEAKSAARARIKVQDEIQEAEARVRAKTRAEARAKAIAEEEARIDAAGADLWFYMQKEVQLGPVTLAEIKEKISDLSLEPPVRLVWTEGMDDWKPVYDVRKLCEPTIPQNDKPAQSSPALTAQKPEINSKSKAAAESQATDEARIAAATRAENDLRAKDARDARIAATEKERARAEQEAGRLADAENKRAEQAKLREIAIAKAEAEEKLKASEEARNAAEAKAAEQTRLLAAAEAKAAEEVKLRAAAIASAQAKAEEQARTAAEAEAKLKAAEAKAAAESKLREIAEAKAAQETKLRTEAETQAAAARALAKAEDEARFKTEAALKIKATAAEIAKATADEIAAQEAKAAAKAKSDEQAKATAKAEAKVQAAEAKAAAEVRLREIAEAKAAREEKLRSDAEAKAAETTKLAIAAADQAEEDDAMAEIEALAAQEARVAAAAKERAEIKARAAEEAKIAAAGKAKARKQLRAKALENAKIRVLARAGMPAAQPNTDSKEQPAENVTTPPEVDAPKKQNFSKVSAKTCWFYTCEGDRLGPVTFEELRTLAESSHLDPRLDMVWRKDMDAWKPAGQIDGLFERNSVPAKPNDSFAPPTATKTQAIARTPVASKGPWPGARRRSLLVASLIFPFVWQYLLAAASPMMSRQLGELLTTRLLPFATYVPLLVLVWFAWKRLANLGMSRLWCLALFAPFLNLWVGYRCLACPAGYAYHKKLDPPGYAIALAYWIVMLIAILLLYSVAAPLLGSIGSPEFKQQVSSLITSASKLAR